jgi:hypothetical protein
MSCYKPDETTVKVARAAHIPTRERIAAAAAHRPARPSVSWRYIRMAPKKNSVNMCRADHLKESIKNEMIVLKFIFIC